MKEGRDADPLAWRDLFTGAIDMAVQGVDFTDLRYKTIKVTLRAD